LNLLRHFTYLGDQLLRVYWSSFGYDILQRRDYLLAQDSVMCFGAALQQAVQINWNVSDRKVCHLRDLTAMDEVGTSFACAGRE
jgi:hypothetical protein